MKKMFAPLVFIVLLCAACTEQPETPIKSDSTVDCSPESLRKLDGKQQSDASARCLREGDFTPSKPKAW